VENGSDSDSTAANCQLMSCSLVGYKKKNGQKRRKKRTEKQLRGTKPKKKKNCDANYCPRVYKAFPLFPPILSHFCPQVRTSINCFTSASLSKGVGKKYKKL